MATKLKRGDIVEIWGEGVGNYFYVEEVVDEKNIWTSRVIDGYEPGWEPIYTQSGEPKITKVKNPRKLLEEIKSKLENQIEFVNSVLEKIKNT